MKTRKKLFINCKHDVFLLCLQKISEAMKKALFFILFSIPILSHAKLYWQRPITNYSRFEYKASNQNWSIAQNSNGWMYFANNKGLLEFDGVFWNIYPFGQEIKARAVMPYGKRIYVGGLGEFGFFAPDVAGHLRYHPLSRKLKEKRTINVWKIHRSENSVIFQADNSLYIYNGTIRKISSPYSIQCSGIVNNILYAATAKGLYSLSGNELTKMQVQQDVTLSDVVEILSYNNAPLAVTRRNGVYLYKDKTWKKFLPNDGEDVSCADIKGQTLVMGTTREGIILYNLSDGQKEKAGLDNGMQNLSVLDVKLDNRQNLWIGYANGIDYISLNSPLLHLYTRLSAIGAGYASCIYGGKLYLGTNQGLYTTDIPQGANSVTNPEFVNGTNDIVYCLTEINGSLFCGGRNFFMRKDRNGTTYYPIRGVWNVTLLTSDGNTLILGTFWGLYLMTCDNGTWSMPMKIKDSGISPKSLCVEDGSNAIWIANKERGIVRIVLSNDMKRAVRQKEYNGNKLPQSNICISKIDGTMVFATRRGLFRYNATDDRIEEFANMEKMLDGKVPYTFIHQDKDKNIWYVAHGQLALLRYDKRRKSYTKNKGEAWLNGNLVEDYESITITGGKAIIGTEDGFTCLNIQPSAKDGNNWSLHIRKLFVTNGMDSLIMENIAKGMPPIRIKYGENSLRIEYGMTCYEKTGAVLYSCRLEGPDGMPWSEYAEANSKEYTNLHEGRYKFTVRASIGGNTDVATTSIEFVILPPWYRSWWAYTLYILMVLAAIGTVYYRIRKSKTLLISRNEEMLAHQEERFKIESEKKDKKIETLKDKNLMIELRSKSDELISSHVNNVRKNEMLSEIKKTVQGIYNTMNEENLPGAKRRIAKLLKQIDTNIGHDDDIKAFQNSFDAVHHDFFKVLDEKCPGLSHKEKMLCAYIKLNMLTKEIAPLLNISVRGVEIGRYRLRKKLGLDERASLTKFLQTLAD